MPLYFQSHSTSISQHICPLNANTTLRRQTTKTCRKEVWRRMGHNTPLRYPRTICHKHAERVHCARPQHANIAPKCKDIKPRACRLNYPHKIRFILIMLFEPRSDLPYNFTILPKTIARTMFCLNAFMSFFMR